MDWIEFAAKLLGARSKCKWKRASFSFAWAEEARVRTTKTQHKQANTNERL